MNFKEDITNLCASVRILSKDIELLRSAVAYNTKLLEEVTLAIKPKEENNEIVNNILSGLKDTVLSDPNIGKRKDVQDLMEKMFNVAGDK
jgi:hypothetical protein